MSKSFLVLFFKKELISFRYRKGLRHAHQGLSKVAILGTQERHELAELRRAKHGERVAADAGH
jgi:hypothetical protein